MQLLTHYDSLIFQKKWNTLKLSNFKVPKQSTMKQMQLLCNDGCFKAPSLIVIIWSKLGSLTMSNSLVTQLLRVLNHRARTFAEQDSQVWKCLVNRRSNWNDCFYLPNAIRMAHFAFVNVIIEILLLKHKTIYQWHYSVITELI